MGTTLPNLGLYQPGGGSSGLITPDEVADVDRLNDNFKLLDDFAGTTDTRLDAIEDSNIRAQLISNTDTINGTVTLNWNTAVTGIVYQQGGKFWGGTAPDVATVVLLPKAGRYRIYYSYRTTGVAPLTLELVKNGVTMGLDTQASGTGVVGAASHATRQIDLALLATDKLQLRATSNTVVTGRGQITLEYLGAA